jgi:murein DD-endopeptidase
LPSSPDKLPFADALGLRPLGLAWQQTRLALSGDPYAPPSRFGPSSLRILRPALSARTWLSREQPRITPIYNLFNHTQTPEADGWSVRKTQVRDYRGGALTYDSHNGTDFVLAPGTPIVAPAAGRVVLVSREFQRGGLKLMLEHGEGLATSYAHLGRVLVAVGDRVAAGQALALSGASGLNFVASLLADPPHLHFNVWLDGRPVDPFAREGETALWLSGNEPRPAPGGEVSAPESDLDVAAADETIAGCRDPALRAALEAIGDGPLRACAAMFHANYHPTRFTRRPAPYRSEHARRPRLALPLEQERFDGVEYLSD